MQFIIENIFFYVIYINEKLKKIEYFHDKYFIFTFFLQNMKYQSKVF